MRVKVEKATQVVKLGEIRQLCILTTFNRILYFWEGNLWANVVWDNYNSDKDKHEMLSLK